MKKETKKKEGRPLCIPDPETMWKHFEDYKQFTKGNPIMKHVFVGKNGDSTYEERERPLTYEGFCNYINDIDVMSNPDHYFFNYENRYVQFVAVCTRIKRTIRQDQIAGGMAGIYNPSITQRLNNLVEKSETTIVEQPLFPDAN